MLDKFSSHTLGLTAPAQDGFSITPTDGLALSEVTRALYVGVGGDIALTLRSGASLVFFGVASGTVLPLRVARVAATGTTASELVGLV